MHFNVKDVPETIFFGLVIIAVWGWYEKPVLWRAILSGALWGLALGVKANALFIPVILIASLLPWTTRRQPWGELLGRICKTWWQIPVMGIIGGIVYFVTWPYLFLHPLNNLMAYWKYIFSQGGRTGILAFSIDPLRQVITTMPEVMLVGLLVGLVLLTIRIFREQKPIYRVLLVWFIFPILRVSLPGAVNFDGIRHFLEFAPAAALICAFGMDQVVGWLARRKIAPFTVQTVVVGLVAVNFALICAGYYPYLHIYYNSLTGGLAGARATWLGGEASDYWGSSYRQGMEWLRANAGQDAQVYAMPADWIAQLSAPVFLRPDIQVHAEKDLPDFSVLDQSEKPVYLMYNLRKGPESDEIAYCQARKIPVYQIVVDDVIILQIFEFGKN
jgi:hypothetical protein